MNKKLFLKLGLGLGVVATISSAALFHMDKKIIQQKKLKFQNQIQIP